MSLFGKRGPTKEEIVRENAIKRNISDSFSHALKSLQQQYIQTDDKIQSTDLANTICNVLEAVFIHGLKESFSTTVSSLLIGSDPGKTPQPVFWDLLTRFTHRDTVSQLNHLGQVTTQIGMCRAWIRIALNDGVMESYLDAMLADTSTLCHFYKKTAYLRDAEQPGILKSYLQGLSNLQFDLSYNSSMLNIWTTSPLVLAGLMEPSLTSHPSPQHIAEQPVETVTEEVSSLRDEMPIVIRSSGHGARAKNTRLPVTPPNTPFGASQLTSSDIDEIRRLTMNRVRSTGSNSTRTSQISCPDPVDHRTEPDFPVLEKATNFPSGSSPLGSGRFVNSGFKGRVRKDSMQEPDVPVIPENEDMETGGSDKENMVDGGDISDSMKEENKERSTDSGPVSKRQKDGMPQELPSDKDGASRNDASPTDITDTQTTASPSHSERPNSLFSSDGRKFLGQRRKSAPLDPVLTITTATSTFVEVATEASPTKSVSPGSEAMDIISDINNADLESEDIDIYGGGFVNAPTPQSNCLGTMTGWSSEFEDSTGKDEEQMDGETQTQMQEEEETHRAMTSNPSLLQSQISTTSTLDGSIQESQSFDRLLKNYGMNATPINASTMRDVLNTLPNLPSGGSAASRTSTSLDKNNSSESSTYEDFEVISASASVMSKQADPRTQSLVAVVGEITTEKGLDFQNYQCHGCSRPIGMIYGKARTCTYDSCYYCYECHENEEYYIPARIIHNWDFRKHKVANHTYRFLKDIEEDPLINLKNFNPRLYEHVLEVNEVMQLRQQLRYLKAYLYTCRQSVADDLRRQVWPKEYLYDDIHLYSLQDLLQIPTGQMAASIKKVIKYACRHVYECRLCSQKGFICEICSAPKVIYPFQVEATVRCEKCNSVFHKECKRETTACPKCERRRNREMKTGAAISTEETVDYGQVIA